MSGSLISGKKTALISAAATMQSAIATMGAAWTALVAAQADARITTDGTVRLSGGGRLDDICGLDRLIVLVLMAMQSQGMDVVVNTQTNDRAGRCADLGATVTAILGSN